MASTKILATHFEKRKHLAFSVVGLGAYIGMVSWPSVSQHLLENYGYSMSMRILACLHTVHIIAGILYIENTGYGQMANASTSAGM